MKEAKTARFLRALRRALVSSAARDQAERQRRTRRGGQPWVHGKPKEPITVIGGPGSISDRLVKTYRAPRPDHRRPESVLRDAFLSVRATRRT